MYSLRKTTPFIMILLTAAILTGCGSAETKREQSFSNTITLFKSALRWHSDAEQSAFFINPNSANLPSRYGLRVVDVDQLGPAIETSENERTLEVRLYLLNEQSQSVRQINDRQQWKWLGEEKGWKRSNPLPTPR